MLLFLPKPLRDNFEEKMLLVTAHPKLFFRSQVLNTVIVHLRIEHHFLASSTRDDETIYGMRDSNDEVATKHKRG